MRAYTALQRAVAARKAPLTAGLSVGVPDKHGRSPPGRKKPRFGTGAQVGKADEEIFP